MIRLISTLVGIFFVGMLLFSFGTGAGTYLTTEQLETAEHKYHKKPEAYAFASDGALGQFDEQQLQRGLKVYQEVCAACHSMKYISFRNFAALGYDEDQIKNLAANWPIPQPTVNKDTGETDTRPNLPADRLPTPFPNEVAARAANNNAVPPDLSLMTKARPGGANYVRSLLLGYQEPSAELLAEFPDAAPGEGLHHNPWFPNLNLAMAQPLVIPDQVTYDDGTEASVEQMATDVAAFLIWTAEPKLEERRQTGWAVLAFLLIAAVLAFLSYKQIWADKKKG
ncbi:cytochrome c1 [Parasphingorhabdus sp. DH2-15]|uniref:cytochrome c1 n=1 Tax=Parasphingorhabdus sp. DH2-15 TaxID=3444112 RepID=UPI003F685CBC